MNPASLWRLELARRIAPFYARQPAVQVVEVGGSVSRGCADRYSDIEIGVFWAAPPTDEIRQGVADQANGTDFRSFGFAEDEWSEEFLVQGVKIDVSHRLVRSMESLLEDVIDRYETDVAKQGLISAVEHAVPISGAALLTQWQAKAKPYPPGLAEAMVRDHLMLGPHIWLEMLAERNSVIELYSLVCIIQKRLLSVLMGLNRVYHPGFKWLDRLVADLPLAPHDLGARLQQVFRLPPAEGVRETRILIEETYRLVEAGLPSIDTTAAWARLNQQRPIWDDAPLKL